MQELHDIQVRPLIQRALEEDWSHGDWATDVCLSKEQAVQAWIVANESLVYAGSDVLMQVFRCVDPQLKLNICADQGAWVTPGEALLEINGSAQSILKAERVALNLLGRMCGIATLTRTVAEQLQGASTQLRDTRRTTPGLRLLEKSAMLIGGARNHRFGLCDGVVVRENHCRAAGGIKQAVSRLMESLAPTLKIEVEVTSQEEVRDAIDAGADLIILNQMTVPQIAEAVRLIGGQALVEVSGTHCLDHVGEIADAGVDFISTSVIIRTARWSEISLRMSV